jgi:acetoin utilization deacetylase AcuC-like enzyme
MAARGTCAYLWRVIHVVHHPDYVTQGPARSTYRWGKNGAIRDTLRHGGDAVRWHVPEPVAVGDLEAVHTTGYVAEVLAAAVPPEKERRIGFAVTDQVARRARVVPGGTLLAARLAIEHGFAANTAGGSHHALADTGAGYCVFNDLAVAAARLVGEGHRVLVVDCDVHQGDGTAALLEGYAGCATYSIHAAKNFPVRKARSTLDVALPDNVGDDAYLAALETSLVPLLDGFAPDVVLYQAGVDPYAGDRLGRLALSEEGLVARDRLIGGLMATRGLPIASTVGGGYGDDTLAIARRHVRAIMTLGETIARARHLG